jgi:hypothetical protein
MFLTIRGRWYGENHARVPRIFFEHPIQVNRKTPLKSFHTLFIQEQTLETTY